MSKNAVGAAATPGVPARLAVDSLDSVHFLVGSTTRARLDRRRGSSCWIAPHFLKMCRMIDRP